MVAQHRRLDLGVDEPTMEEMGAILQGESAPCPQAFLADEEVDMLRPEVLVRGVESLDW